MLFAKVLSSNEDRDRPWALVLECMALKKSSNESVFGKIRDELIKEEGYKDVHVQTEQLRRKYKWLKQEWRKINYKISNGSGLGAKDTELPRWYGLLDPIFTQGMDGMLTLSSKSDDICSGDSDMNSDNDSEKTESDIVNIKVIENRKRSRSISSVNSSSINERGSSDESDRDDDKPLRSDKEEKRDATQETSIKSHYISTRKRMPKTQTAAMWQIAQNMKECTEKQEKKSDERLTALLEAERKRDELFLNFQREQAKANRQHELMLAQLLVQSGVNHPHTSGFQVPPMSNPSPVGYQVSLASTVSGGPNPFIGSDDGLSTYQQF